MESAVSNFSSSFLSLSLLAGLRYHHHHLGGWRSTTEVVEIRDSGGGFIHGKVTPQTRVNNRPYDVKVEEHLIDCNATYTFNDVQNVPYCTEGSLFGQYIQSEKDIEPLREIAREEEEKRKEEAYIIMDQIYRLQESRRDYSCYEVLSVDDLKMRLRKYTCPPELQSKYEEKIVADRSECLSISVLSESQSDCFEWFEERAKRVTCSSKAHRIKTRRDAFESLASQFKKNKFDGKMTEAMKYGLETESNARKSFEEQSGLKVTSVGLIINMTQPFMATSPDGIILSESSLLEIKCL
ncbi:hypothetical protein EVAR_47892_1 [Eumeta japonica]|uniref:YqaJ viral recombinase domain-containing protein n=1 Tax=Eumeta variegata TaxID=151549 RepID=A0A4C1Y7P1_EUMVA|nr:hypothetical protein EVAR_47892_1 [Eumeta japonica]